MPRSLGDAFFNVSPETAGFRAKLIAGVKKSMAGVKGEVPITADTAKLDAAIAATKAKLGALQASSGELRIDADAKAVTAKIASIQAQMAKLAGSMDDLKIDADNKAAVAHISALQAQTFHLRKAMEKMEVGVDIAAAEDKIAALEAQTAYLEHSLSEFVADVDIRKASTQIQALAAEIKALQERANIVPELEQGAINAQIAALQAKLVELTKERDIQIKPEVDLGPLTRAAVLMKTIFGSGLGGGGGGGNNDGGAGPLIFGWGRFNRILGASILGVKAWHIAASAALEATIALVTAAAAAAVGIAAMAPAAKDVATQMKAIDVVNEAMGAQIPSLSRSFDILAKSLAPQVIEAYGGAVKILTSNSKAFQGTAKSVVNLVDDWIAKVVIWQKTQGGIGTILQHGVGFLRQFGDILGNLGSAIVHLLAASPGVAHFLLDLIDGFSKVLNWVSKLPTPLLTLALAFHGVFTWGGALLGLMTKMPFGIGLASRAVVKGLDLIGAALGGVTVAGVLTGLAALAFLAYKIYQAWTSSTPGVTKAIDDVNASLDKLTASQAFYAIPIKIGEMNTQLVSSVRQLQITRANFNLVGASAGQASKLGSDLHGILFNNGWKQGLGSLVNSVKDFWNAMTGSTQAAQNMQQASNSVGNLRNEINKLLGSQKNMDESLGHLIHSNLTFGSGASRVQTGLALMDLAGVKWTDTVQQMDQKVQDLVDGYKSMSVQGRILNNSVNAITFAASLQSSKVNDLNTSWDTFISTVTGSETAFTTVETSINGMFTAAASAGAHMTDSNGRVSSSFGQLAATAGGAKGSFTGLNTTSLALAQTFNQTLTNANSMLDALQTQAAAAGLGKKGTDLLTKATVDLIVQMAPAARGSKLLTAELWTLAQRGGLSYAQFKNLLSGVTKVKSPMKDLQGIVTTFTVKASNLTDDVKNLSTALGTTLVNAEANAILASTHGQQALQNFATAALKSGANVRSMQPSANKLAQSILQMTGNVTDAKREFLAFAIGGLHLSSEKANELWANFQKTIPSVQAAAKKAADAKTHFADWAHNGIGVSIKQADDLWKKLQGQKLDFAGSKAHASEQAFIKWAHQVGIGKQQAEDLWAALRKQNLDDWLSHKLGVNESKFFGWTKQLHISNKAANDFWAMLAQQKFDFLSGKADDNKNHFIKLAGQFGINKDKAAILWAELRKQELENTKKHADNASGAMDILHRKVGDLSSWAKLTNYLGSTVGHALASTAGGIGKLSEVYNAAAKTLGVAAIKTVNNAAAAIAGLFRGFALGGGVSGGIPGRDSVPAMLMPGEVVVPTNMVQAGAVDHLRGRLPGFAGGGTVKAMRRMAAGGYVTPFPGWTPRPERIDQGVDFAGTGPIAAIGDAIITETNGGGWPGGPYMSYRLTSGADAGDYIYVAENIRPVVRAGQKVHAGQHIADMFNAGTGIEMGFAAPGGGSPLSQTAGAGGISGANLPGGGSRGTAVGKLFDQLLISLGVPAAPNFNLPTGGRIPSGNFGGSGGFGGATPAQTAAFNKAMKIMNAAQKFTSFGALAGVITQSVRNTGAGAAAKLTAAYNAINAAAGGVPGGISSGSEMHNLVTIARYLMSQGASRAGGAGIAGTIAGESGGNPESRGSGGFGLIGWTGNTIGLPTGYHPNGNASRDLAIQMAGIIGYARARPGGWPDGFRSITDPVAAGDLWSRYEAPKHALSDTRPDVARQVYAALGGSTSAAQAAKTALQTVGRLHLAAGGLVPTLTKQQHEEMAAYDALHHALGVDLAHPNKFVRGHRRGIISELGTLAKRQSAEQAAFSKLSGKGLTPANLRALVGRAHSTETTSRDKDLNLAEPQLAGHLMTMLKAIAFTAGGGLPSTGGHGSGGGVTVGSGRTKVTVPPTAAPGSIHALHAELNKAGGDEIATYAALLGQFSHGKLSVSARNELKTLATRQKKLLTLLHTTSGAGLTKASLSQLGTAAREAGSTAGDVALSRAHPVVIKSLETMLARIASISAAGMPKSGSPGTLTPDQLLAQAQAKLLAYDLAAFKPTSLVFDRGGTLRPGGNYVWNATGHPEPLVPADTGGGGGGLTIGERAILEELRAIRNATQAAPVAFGRTISGAMTRSAGRGYYGG